MIQKIKGWIKNSQLKESERKWELYDLYPKVKIYWIFAFTDQLKNGGFFNTQITYDKERCENNSVIVVNINKRVSEEVIISIITHESIHVAIHNCIMKGYDFIETVIDEWMQGTKIIQEGWDGDLKIIKVQKDDQKHNN